MNTPTQVSGSACLDYINREIGYAFRRNLDDWGLIRRNNSYEMNIHHGSGNLSGGLVIPTTLYKIRHNPSTRKIGLILNEYEDGGYRVAILGGDTLRFQGVFSYVMGYHASVHYKLAPLPESLTHVEKDVDAWNGYPDVRQNNTIPAEDTYNIAYIRNDYGISTFYTFDETISFNPTYTDNIDTTTLFKTAVYNGATLPGNSGVNFALTNNVNTTLRLGEDAQTADNEPVWLDSDYVGDPLHMLTGKLYSYFIARSNTFYALTPRDFPSDADLASYEMHTGSEYTTYNGVCIPYNLLLTKSATFASAYLQNGTLPPDAVLFPLDFDSLPSYDTDNEPDDGGGDGGGEGDSTTPDGDPDDTYIIDANLPTVPAFTPSAMSNNNYYWLTVSQLSDFVRWFWNDVGDLDNIDDLLQKVDGLYSDLASAILSFRYMPVDVSWIGGLTSDNNIIVGMIEKEGAVNCLSKNPPPIREIGSFNIKRQHNNFLDYAPYTNISLYLPLHGFIDLDSSLFMNHTINVKAVFDFISGTLLYLIYLDNKLLVNSVMVKVAIDIPITLQSKNDRDSAIFQNVSSTVSGLVGGAISASTGNPLGVIYGASQVASQTVAPPLKVLGTMGEQPSLYAPQKCELIIKSPLECRAGDFNSRVGLNTHRQVKLSNCSGLTIVHNPRISFTSHILDSEIEQIYNYLQEGVII